MKAILNRAVSYARAHPSRIIGWATAAVVFVATAVGIVVPEQSVVHALEIIVPILIGTEATHANVSPAK